MNRSVLDPFEDLSDWGVVASGLAELRLTHERDSAGPCMRLDYDFKGGGGFVVARRVVSLSLAHTYAFHFDVRGAAPRNKFELKLVDPSGKNVWRWQQDAFDFAADWQPMRIGSSQFEFAWGPAGGGSAAEVAAIEFAITAGPGGKGTVWISRLEVEDLSFPAEPTVTASTAVSGHEAGFAVDANPESRWRSVAGAAEQWFLIDLENEHEYGGLIIDWDPAAPARRFSVQTSNDAASWKLAYAAPRAGTKRNYASLPSGNSRYIRIELEAADATKGVGISSVRLQPYDFSRSINEFFHNVAAGQPRGHYPKYLRREQTYWTPVGISDGVARALLNEEGMVEVDEGTFSIEPFLTTGGKLFTWADAAPVQQLEDDYLPIPSSLWTCGDVTLRTTAFATGTSKDAVLYIRYRVEHSGTTSKAVRLFAALRPFQVTPPWQSFRNLGGVSPVREIVRRPNGIWINRSRAVVPLTEPSRYGAATFDEDITGCIETRTMPDADDMRDNFGYGWAALCYELDVEPGVASDVYLAIPFGAAADIHDAPLLPAGISGAEQFELAVHQWRETLGEVEIRVPAVPSAIDALRTAAAHILINRDGPALQPGPRRYTRSWIRDGAIMGAALLRVGCDDAMREFIRWYAPFQREDGFVPCVIDRDGVDWLVEHDSHGQLVYAVMEEYRLTGDRAFLAEMWPVVHKAVGCIERLRGERLTPEYQTGDMRACYGLLPESASHEGYLAHPVHSYWDDFWGVRGIKDAAAMAAILDHPADAQHLTSLHADFAKDLYASIRTTISMRKLDYIPGSVEWADFDPTATSNALGMLDESANLPADVVDQMFEKFFTGFRSKRAGAIDWTNYTPYGVRLIGALVRIGKREGALELFEFALSQRRPVPWNQWPEISWRDPTSPGHLGDLPHSWIGAEYMLSLLSMFAFERDADESLVIGAGLSSAWLSDAGGVEVRGLPTWYGKLSYTLRRESASELQLHIDGDLAVPRGGIVARLPFDAAPTEVLVNGTATRSFTAEEVVIRELPADVIMR
ncbi:MAG TPA: discoidin domain-containing protein [Candidatus Limnocylindrales bacterium]|nr:discoidin domain-containing protein [Candidatus Limnocylindrales bacterium]